eukprot:TRINITY_DN8233_c0_g1_i2.p1 TRINITY_DN8233_c0_g1~~TRINITY_DN8233_c0_g1_i2.p1  ORF type:complete len:209 (+),score=46.56 TRINITY_DN8233_c0_g1_i2:200-826(+)
MGSNHCKELGIRPNKPISSKDLELICLKYGEVGNCLSEKATWRLLNDLAAALEIPFSHSIANQLLERCQTRVVESKKAAGKKKIMFYYEDLMKIFVQTERVSLTESANAKLEDHDAHGNKEEKVLSPEEMLQIFIDEENAKADAMAKVSFESTEPNVFDSLPVELIVHIFNHLDDKSFCRARELILVSSRSLSPSRRVERFGLQPQLT